MSAQELNVALIAGPMYDPLYESLPEFTRVTGVRVRIGFHGVHSELNAHLASFLESTRDVPYHLVSTHTKYAPSQRRFLAELPNDGLEDFFPAVLGMATMDGALFGLPRNIDAKLLHYRRDLVSQVPWAWDELVDTAGMLTGNGRHGFVLTGKDSGLFGIFYELAEMGGARLFPRDNVPQLNNQGGDWALRIISELYRSGSVPHAVVDWQFDEAHRYFRDGHAAMICDWPGYYASYCGDDSEVRGKFGLARMPAGPSGVHKAYAGSHTFALTTRGRDEPAAMELLRFLTSAERQLQEARRGSVPVRRSVLNAIREQDSNRWDLLEQVIAHDTLVPPRLSYYPEIEEILWRTVRSAMTGALGAGIALNDMERRIAECHLRNAQAGQYAS
jgi:multiple sugar transport system substrate-binding protein